MDDETADLPSRREFLKVMAASMAMAALAGCGEGPPSEAIPYVVQPEDVVPGRPRFYATATLFEGYAQPVLAEIHDGRPTKLDGNALHPAASRGSDPFLQAAVLELYDPDRSGEVIREGVVATWEEAFTALADIPAPLRLLTGSVTSPTLQRQIEDLLARRPDARWHVFEPVGRGLRAQATELAFGQRLDVHWRLDRAPVVVSLGEDLLGPGPDQMRHVRDWADARREAERPPRLWVAEATPSLTGAGAHRRQAVSEYRLPMMVSALGAAFGLAEAPPGLTEEEQDWIARAAADLRNRGGIVAVSSTLPVEVQALGLAITRQTGGDAMILTEPVAVPGQGGLADLVEEMAAGQVGSLLILDANPAYTAPADLDFPAALERVPLRIHAGLYQDETALLCQWHLPLAHALESWGDARAVDGTAIIMQPMIRPLRNGIEAAAILPAVLGQRVSALDEVRATWAGPLGSEDAWRRALHDGLVEGSAPPPVAVQVRPVPPVPPPEGPPQGLEIVFRPDPTIWDGRFANNPWLQELPKPLNKIVWDNVALISSGTAQALGVRNGALIQVTAGGRSVNVPAWIMPFQAEDTVTLFLGYGRRQGGRLATGIGYDAYTLRPAASPWRLTGASLARAGGQARIAETQLYHEMGGRDLVPVVAPGEAMPQPTERQPSIYPPWTYESYAWGMVVDTDLCTGCNACVVACMAENNVPVVGKDEVLIGREMHWLRVDSYDLSGDTRFLPVPCMHCEKAPCEVGCPVNATVHGPEGLNQMVYNRCIGTRTCSSYCPYKVRRFNYYEYSARQPETAPAQRNPDVTVRGRGVMEKCTYCVQRINAARIQAEMEGRPIAEGEVTTACQDACPAGAIIFGDLNNPDSAVSRARANPRNYRLLEELNTWPRTTYLAAVRDREGQA
ncbi:4Fe-4S dicluster domain-containing protein [Telmatospirillum sp. J64-1]|uniref:4Fe-4S dicluster domain-containing protein n=1 Tax=Telmatospirillum sp. J64-1 TaxID=2502183 RepID=UPI00163D4A1C|nr:4Fe-4S dicluster domain-containing protein [Telmatospirillum sp. J64-1]